MTDKPQIIYAVIAKDKDTILSDYTDYTGNFQQNSIKILRKVVSNHNATIHYQSYKFHYLDKNGITVLSMSNQEFPDNVIYCFLEDLYNNFTDMFDLIEINKATAYSLNKKFNNSFKNSFYYYNQNPVCNDAISKLKNQVIEFKKNVFRADELLNERGEKLQEINVKAISLQTESENYYKSAKKVKRTTKLRKVLLIFTIIVIILIVGWLLSSFICGFDYSKC